VVSNTDTLRELLLTTSKSGRPSPLTSAAATDWGRLPVAKVCWGSKLGGVAPGRVVFANTDTVPEGSVGASRSGRPSPLASAATTETGRLPVAKVCWSAKLGAVAPATVVFSSTDTVAELWLATSRSSRPSPLTSAAVTEAGLSPVAKVCWG